MIDDIISFFLKKKGIEIGDYVKVLLEDGSSLNGIIMPKHEFSHKSILVIKLDNGYNIGLDIKKIVDVEKMPRHEVVGEVRYVEEEIEEKELPHVLVMGVGGTILSRVDYVTGAVKSAVSAEELLSILPEVRDIAEIETKIIMNKYSEHITPNDWGIIAKNIYFEVMKKKYDGIVVLHGTDTLAYTAAALSFSMQRLPIPIVLVGSQRSSDRPSSDAALNLISAIRIAGYSDIAEVIVAMHLTTSDEVIAVHQGTRVRKTHTSRRDAFTSIDTTPYLLINSDGDIKKLRDDYKKRTSDYSPILYPKFSDKVVLLKFYPGFDKNILLSLHRNDVKAIILEGTGLGHVGEYLHETIEMLIREGVHVYMTSQCIWGRVNMNVYDTGRLLMKIGVIPLENIISETAYVKASWALGNFGLKELDVLMRTNLVGEAVPRSPVYNMRREHGESI